MPSDFVPMAGILINTWRPIGCHLCLNFTNYVFILAPKLVPSITQRVTRSGACYFMGEC